jgi:hypothetical protein
MKRPVKSSDGLYHIKGKTYRQVRGSRIQVWNSNAYKTEGGLHRSQLTKSNGRIVSLKKHKTAKKEMRLQKYGYFAQKGKFGYVKKDVSKKRRGTKKTRGGGIADSASPFTDSPAAAAQMKGGSHISSLNPSEYPAK